MYNWNPGPRRGKEGAIEKQIAWKWHIITLQEAIGYVDHDLLTNRLHVTHYGGCAVLFNKDPFCELVIAFSHGLAVHFIPTFYEIVNVKQHLPF